MTKARGIFKPLMLSVLAMAALALSGCVTTTMHLNIHRNGSATLEAEIGAPQEMWQMFGHEVSPEEMRRDFNMPKATVREFNRDGLAGMLARQKFRKVEQALDALRQFDFGGTLKTVDGEPLPLFSEASLTREDGKEVLTLKTDGAVMRQAIREMGPVTAKVKITAPGRIESVEGGEVGDDGRSVVWNIPSGSDGELRVEYRRSGFSWPAAVFGGLLLAAGLAAWLRIQNPRGQGWNNGTRPADGRNAPTAPGERSGGEEGG